MTVIHKCLNSQLAVNHRDHWAVNKWFWHIFCFLCSFNLITLKMLMKDNSSYVIWKPEEMNFSVFTYSSQFSHMFLVSAANNYIKGWREKSASSLASLGVLAHQSRHPRGSKMKVSRWVEEEEGRGGHGGWKQGGNTPGRTLVSIRPLLPSSPPQKKHSFLSSSSRSPPNPSLLHCICFLIRSVWEAHEPPPTSSLAFLSVAVML